MLDVDLNKNTKKLQIVLKMQRLSICQVIERYLYAFSTSPCYADLMLFKQKQQFYLSLTVTLYDVSLHESKMTLSVR